MSPASPEELRLHRRLLDGDVSASAEIFDRFTAGLAQSCYQTEGAHYAIMIAAVLEDPDFLCYFGWCRTYGVSNSPAASRYGVGGVWYCDMCLPFKPLFGFGPRCCGQSYHASGSHR